MKQLEALLPPSGGQVIVDVFQGSLHPVAEKAFHGYVLLFCFKYFLI